MQRRRHRASGRIMKKVAPIALALGVSLAALMAAPGVGASPGHSAAGQRPAETPGPGTPVSTVSPAPTVTPNAPTITPIPTVAPTTAPTPVPTAIPGGTSTPGATPTTGGTASATATLGHVPTGTLSVTYNPTTRVARTSLNMTGLAQGGTAVTVVMSGTCSAPGGVAWQGATFTADANGKVANFKVNYSNVNGVPTGDVVAIQTVQGGNETRSGYLLACGPVMSTKTAGRNSGSVTLGPVPGAVDGNITGSATLAQANGNLVVTVKASGLQPGSTNATALDLGSCQWQDYVLYDLPPMTADSNGNGQVTMTIQGAQPISSSNNWYIAIDYNSTINKAYFMTAGCGNVVVDSSS